MKIMNREISVANRFIYYYANFVDRIYGFVTRRDGENIPEEHYVGRLDKTAPRRLRSRHRRVTGPPLPSAVEWQGDPLHPHLVDKGRRGSDPRDREIVLFLYRKHLMLGRHVNLPRGNSCTVVAEDGRRLAVRKSALVYLTGSPDNEEGTVLGPYAESVRELSRHIDLAEVWELFRGERTEVSAEEIASLYWSDDVDSSRRVALYLYLERDCPHFECSGPHVCRLVAPEAVQARRRALERRAALGKNRREFLAWLGSQDDDGQFDEDSLTSRQAGWLEQIRQYALWGGESTTATQARCILSEALGIKSSTPRRTFQLLVAKGVWTQDENLDLLREEIPVTLPGDAIASADSICVTDQLCIAGRKRLRGRKPFEIRHDNQTCSLAFTVRRRLLGGYEVGVHIPDVASFVAPDSPIDRAASDRLAAARLPDLQIPMLPPRIASHLGRFSRDCQRPALSIFYDLDRRLRPGPGRLARTSLRLSATLTPGQVADLCAGDGGDFARAIGVVDRHSRLLRSARVEQGAVDLGLPGITVSAEGDDVHISTEDAQDPGRRITEELSIFAATAVGAWCVARGIPAIFETQDPADDIAPLAAAPTPTVLRHERKRLMPPVDFRSEPGHHHGLGVGTAATVVNPAERYTDLLVQRQVCHVLQEGRPMYDEEALAPIRYRAREEIGQLDGLSYRRSRFFILKHLSSRQGQTYDATALHIRRDGVLVEISGLPLKALVHPTSNVSVGQSLRVRLTGVDTWRGHAHFQVESREQTLV